MTKLRGFSATHSGPAEDARVAKRSKKSIEEAFDAREEGFDGEFAWRNRSSCPSLDFGYPVIAEDASEKPFDPFRSSQRFILDKEASLARRGSMNGLCQDRQRQRAFGVVAVAFQGRFVSAQTRRWRGSRLQDDAFVWHLRQSGIVVTWTSSQRSQPRAKIMVATVTSRSSGPA